MKRRILVALVVTIALLAALAATACGREIVLLDPDDGGEDGEVPGDAR